LGKDYVAHNRLADAYVSNSAQYSPCHGRSFVGATGCDGSGFASDLATIRSETEEKRSPHFRLSLGLFARCSMLAHCPSTSWNNFALSGRRPSSSIFS